MKKILIWVLVIGLLAGFLFPFFSSSDQDLEIQTARFGFNENINAVSGQEINIPFELAENCSALTLSISDSILLELPRPKRKESFLLDTRKLKLGAYLLQLSVTDMNGEIYSTQATLRILAEKAPQKWTLKLGQSYTHDAQNYTQGLCFFNDELYESTGDPNQNGSSMIAKIDLQTGTPIQKDGLLFKKQLDASKFGEGMAILNNEIFQITWQNQQCFVYDLNTFELKKELTYRGEGWGLCTDGSQLIMSDGTERITFRDPKNFSVLRTLDVYTDQGPLPQLNELEYIDGLIYANIYTSNFIAVIDPNKGNVLAIIDANNLVNAARGNGEVLNGIAYNSNSQKIYMTGKYWPKLVEVSIIK